MTDYTSLVDTYGVYTYKSDLIYYKVEFHDDWKCRELSIRKDPIAKIYITKLDEEIFAEKPIFTPDIFEAESSETEPGAEIEKRIEVYDVAEEWELEKWDKLLKRMFDEARTHSYCVVQLYDRKPYWRIFTEREITEIDYDDYDNPIGCTVEWSKTLIKGGKKQYLVHKEKLTFYNENKDNNEGTALFVPFGNPSGDNLGEYDLEAIWDFLIEARYIRQDIVNNSAKCSGFYWFMYGDALGKKERQNLVDAVDIASSGRAIGAKESQLKQITAMYPAKPEFSIQAMDEILTLISGATRLPLEFFRGERIAGGMNSGFAGYIDEAKVNAKKKYIFGEFKRYIMKLIEMRWGIILEDVIPYIETEQVEQFEQINMNPIFNKNKDQDNKKGDNNAL